MLLKHYCCSQTKFCIGVFPTQPQTLFIFLQSKVASDTNTLELSNEILLNETKLDHVNTKVTRVFVCEEVNR